MSETHNSTNNIYCILAQLAELKKPPGVGHFTHHVGDFLIQIWVSRIGAIYNDPNDRITNHSIVDINLHEKVRTNTSVEAYNIVYLHKDVRFKNYAPIKYTDLFELSNGQKMPVVNLCELIKYLHRLSNLSAFS